MAYTTIDDPSAYFHTQLYTGSGSTNAITNDANAGDFQPDWLWIKTRSHASSHRLMDSSRLASGEATLSLRSEDTAIESDIANDGMTSLDSDGFTLNGNGSGGAVNENTKTYVAWQWKANGGTTSSNTDGSITSTVQANTTAGFSIATWTGTGTGGATIGHGLGAVPHLMIVKKRSGTDSWPVYHHKNTSAPETDYLHLDQTIATVDSVDRWNDTAPTSTVVSLGDAGAVNGSGATYVGYFFAEKQGYSKFGKYEGNASADGTFVYTGFKPAWIMFKRTSGIDNWGLFDNKRGYQNATNPLDAYLLPSDSGAESAESDSVDFLSNGFKWRVSSGFRNDASETYIYMAFAEHPFVSSEGVPTTAR